MKRKICKRTADFCGSVIGEDNENAIPVKEHVYRDQTASLLVKTWRHKPGLHTGCSPPLEKI